MAMREAWNHSAVERKRFEAEGSRRMSLEEKIALTDDLYRINRAMHGVYLRCFYLNATDQQVLDHWVRITCEPQLYVAVREHRMRLGYEVLPLPMPPDVRIDTAIRGLLKMEPRQVFCEQYHESHSANAAV